MSTTATWQRVKTTKRYLHGPLSERLFTLWAEGKIVFGEENLNGFPIGAGYEAGKPYYRALESCIVWLLLGEEAKMPDFKNVKHITTADGMPFHGVEYDLGDVKVRMEGLCNITRKTTCFAKVTVINQGAVSASQTVSLMLRSGKECDLVYGAPNGYVSHDPNAEDQKALPATWKQDGCRYTDGVRTLHLKSDVASWNEQAGLISFRCDLAAGAEASFTFSLDMGETADYDYDSEKAKAAAFWQVQLQRLNKLPKKLEADGKKLEMVRHLVITMLQSFSCPIGEEFVLCRQGGLMSIIWPSEALFAIEALANAGEYGEFIEPTIEGYFDYMQSETGEIINRGAYWGSVTASVLYSFSVYAATASKEFFERFKDKAYKAYAWIRDNRRSVVDTEKLAGGLFPASHSNDWDEQFQGWTLTDVFNLFALDKFAAVCQQFGAAEAKEVRNEHTAYLADMKRHFQKFLDAAEGQDELKIPLRPIGEDQYLIDGGFPLIYHGRFILCGVIEDENDIRRVFKYLVNRGVYKNGNYGHMKYKGRDTVWYFSFPDYYWFFIWKKLGEDALAQEVLDAQLNYIMTDEYYMVERLDDSDPYFLPWTPNTSANGRTLTMLMETYK